MSHNHGDWKEEVKRAHTDREMRRAVSHAPGWVIEEGKNHTLFRAPNGGQVACNRHPGDIPRGTRFAIVKAILLLGVLAGLVVWVW